MKFRLKKRVVHDMIFQIDFEKSYLCEIHEWAKPLAHPDVIVGQFKNNEFDGQVSHSIFSQLDTVLYHTGLIQSGVLCGHNCGRIDRQSTEPLNGDVVWGTDVTGRLRYGGKMRSGNNISDVTGKLSRVLKSEIEMLKKLIKYREALMEGFAKYDQNMRNEFAGIGLTDLYKEGGKLLTRVGIYQQMLQDEVYCRGKLLAKLMCPFKIMKKKHKVLLAEVMDLLRRFVVSMLGRGEIISGSTQNNTGGLYKKCEICHPDDPNRLNLINFDIPVIVITQAQPEENSSFGDIVSNVC